MVKVNSLIWFRQDLRVYDNDALIAACEYAKKCAGIVYGIYIVSPKQWQQHNMAAMQIDFIERHINLLMESLRSLNIPLNILTIDNYVNIASSMNQYCIDNNIKAIFASMDPEWNERQRDKEVKALCEKNDIHVNLFPTNELLPAQTVLNKSGKMFRVFTPFFYAWRKKLLAQNLACTYQVTNNDQMVKVGRENNTVHQQIKFNIKTRSSSLWAAGETQALAILTDFIDNKILSYKQNRDFPAIEGTSLLSPFLAIGVLSPKQCISALIAKYPDALCSENAGIKSWLSELCWRDFYRHLLVEFPFLSKGKNFNVLADNINWRNDNKEFEAWCTGKTGYPIVDAAMRQLNETGWMHNRLRMIVASFLTKHLLIDWRWGEHYFKQQLIDGDLAANNGGWQWSAGTGVDPQPYFRIFNPITQGQSFDPNAEFIKHYLPELSGLSEKVIHKLPLQHDQKDMQSMLFSSNRISSDRKVLLENGNSYYFPLVNHKLARQRALMAYSKMKKQET